MIGHVVASRGSDLDLDADVLVVGSGAGGAVVAAELAEAGARVVVVEEGPHVAQQEIQAMRPSQHLRRVWRDAGMSVAIGVGDTPIVNVTMGRAVGGSSLVTGGVCFRTPESVLAEWVRQGLAGMTPEALAPCFDAVERASLVEEVPVSMRSRSTVLFAEGAEKNGAVIEPLRRNTRGCNGCGRCNFGCPHGAKMSVDLTYLPRALAAGAQVWSGCRVDRVELDGDRVIGATGRTLSERASGSKQSGKLRVRAPRVVLAAGAFHSPLVLLSSGLGRKLTQLGRNMTLHPGFRMFARFEERIEGWRGALQSAYSQSYASEGIKLVSLFVPPGVLCATMPGFGPEHVRRAADVPHLAVFGGMLHDQAGGVIRRGPGREPLATYRMAAEDRQKVPRVIRLLAEAFFAAGAREVFPPILGLGGLDADAFRKLDLEGVPSARIECSSQHPLGTCRMGSSPEWSVVDEAGQVWGTRGLYVADGAAIPTSLGVNPQITIMAVATQIAWRMREALGHAA